MNRKSWMMTVFCFLTGSVAGAHGEDKPGPHGGVIRMPGAFHTEVVAVSKDKIRVYLLDMEFKNPTVKDSSLEAEYQGSPVTCQTEKTAFLCAFGKDADLSRKGNLIVRAVREKQRGNEAKYETPLKVAKPSGHSHHGH